MSRSHALKQEDRHNHCSHPPVLQAARDGGYALVCAAMATNSIQFWRVGTHSVACWWPEGRSVFSLQADNDALKKEIADLKAMLDSLSGGKSDLEKKLADLIKEHQNKLKQMAAMARDLQEIKQVSNRLIDCNAGVRFSTSLQCSRRVCKELIHKEGGTAQHTNYWAPRTRKRHRQEHRPQRPAERSDPTQHAKGRTGDCPGPRKGTTTRRNVTQGGLGSHKGPLVVPVFMRQRQGSPEPQPNSWPQTRRCPISTPASARVSTSTSPWLRRA